MELLCYFAVDCFVRLVVPTEASVANAVFIRSTSTSDISSKSIRELRAFEDRFLRRYKAPQIEAIGLCHRKLSLLTRRPRLGNSFSGSASSIQVGA
jgi:hypothetical protein